jgi:hypothetical protein
LWRSVAVGGPALHGRRCCGRQAVVAALLLGDRLWSQTVGSPSERARSLELELTAWPLLSHCYHSVVCCCIFCSAVRDRWRDLHFYSAHRFVHIRAVCTWCGGWSHPRRLPCPLVSFFRAAAVSHLLLDYGGYPASLAWHARGRRWSQLLNRLCVRKCVFDSLAVCLSVRLATFPSVCLSAYLSSCLSVCLSVLHVCLLVWSVCRVWSVCLSVSVCCPSVCLSVCLAFCLSVRRNCAYARVRQVRALAAPPQHGP